MQRLRRKPAKRTSMMMGRCTSTNFLYGVVLILLIGGLVGCNTSNREQALTIEKPFDPAVVKLGRSIYLRHCVDCHGFNGEGDRNWTQVDKEGRFPPPPLNGSGHTWHHPLKHLFATINNGGPDGSRMPAWGNTLNRDEIIAVITWFQSRWPDEVYEAWLKMDQNQ
jgi:mono/diheme cytochrome c family protein